MGPTEDDETATAAPLAFTGAERMAAAVEATLSPPTSGCVGDAAASAASGFGVAAIEEGVALLGASRVVGCREAAASANRASAVIGAPGRVADTAEGEAALADTGCVGGATEPERVGMAGLVPSAKRAAEEARGEGDVEAVLLREAAADSEPGSSNCSGCGVGAAVTAAAAAAAAARAPNASVADEGGTGAVTSAVWCFRTTTGCEGEVGVGAADELFGTDAATGAAAAVDDDDGGGITVTREPPPPVLALALE